MIELLEGYAEPQQQMMVQSVANGGGTQWTEVVMALAAVVTVVLGIVGIYFRYLRK